MANPTSGLLMTVLAAADEASETLKYKNAFIDRIYWDHRPEIKQPYETLRITIPTINEGNVVDIGPGPIQPTDYGYGQTDIKLNHNFSNSYVIKDWDQARIGMNLRTKFFQPRFEEMLRRMNRSIVLLLTAANFPNYTLFTGTGVVANQITRSDIADAWINLANAGVPMDDLTDVSLMTNAATFGGFLKDNNFTQMINVGNEAAVGAQQRAQLAPMLGAVPYFDQMLAPFNAGKAPAVLLHRYAIAGVTASLPPGGSNVEETTVMLRGEIPCRVQVAYSMVDQGWLVNMNCLCGFGVGRPEMASLFQSAS